MDSQIVVPGELTTEKIKQDVLSLGKWFHNINLKGVYTAPDHFLGDYPYIKFRNFADSIPADLKGKTVLDIGCNAGFYSIEMKRRGADTVIGIDSDEKYLAQARYAAGILGLEIDFRNMSVYDVGMFRKSLTLFFLWEFCTTCGIHYLPLIFCTKM